MSYAARPFVDGATDTAPGWGWGTMVLPQLEQAPLYNAVNFSLPVEAPRIRRSSARSSDLSLPSDPVPGRAVSVLDGRRRATSGDDGADELRRVRRQRPGRFDHGPEQRRPGQRRDVPQQRHPDRRITDGTSQTITVGERAWSINSGPWAGVVTNGVIRRGPANPCPMTGALFYLAASLVQAHCNVLNTDTDPDGGIDDYLQPPSGRRERRSSPTARSVSSRACCGTRQRPDGDDLLPGQPDPPGAGTRAGGEVVADAY